MKAIIRIRWDLPWRGANGEDRFPHRNTIEWQRERWRLFTRYTLPSLRRQTHTDWGAWLLMDHRLEEIRCDAGVGCYSYDDVLADEKAAAHITDPRSAAKRLLQSIVNEGRDSIFLGRIDSDDMLAPDILRMMVETAMEPDPRGLDRPFVQLDHGVAWHEQSATLYRWVNPSPPFYGRIVTAADLERGLPGLGHHGEARAKARVIESDDPSFCVTLHGGNISNSKDGSWVRGVIEGERRADIMGRFGLDASNRTSGGNRDG